MHSSFRAALRPQHSAAWPMRLYVTYSLLFGVHTHMFTPFLLLTAPPPRARPPSLSPALLSPSPSPSPSPSALPPPCLPGSPRRCSWRSERVG